MTTTTTTGDITTTMPRPAPRRSTDRLDPTKGAYNGFSLSDRGRASGWGRRLEHVRPRRVPASHRTCCICGTSSGMIGWHSEDYRAPLDALVLCAWCHWALHARFKSYDHVWDSWLAKLAAGERPPVCRQGTRWPTFGARYVRTDPDAWDWSLPVHEPIRPPLADLVHRHYVPDVPEALRISEGAPHLPGQWNSGGVYFDHPFHD